MDNFRGLILLITGSGEGRKTEREWKSTEINQKKKETSSTKYRIYGTFFSSVIMISFLLCIVSYWIGNQQEILSSEKWNAGQYYPLGGYNLGKSSLKEIKGKLSQIKNNIGKYTSYSFYF